jgi:hypothetical protein
MRIKCLLIEGRYTAEPYNIKAILATEFNGFEKGPEFRGLVESLFGTGVFAADGEFSLKSCRHCSVNQICYAMKETCGSDFFLSLSSSFAYD